MGNVVYRPNRQHRHQAFDKEFFHVGADPSEKPNYAESRKGRSLSPRPGPTDVAKPPPPVVISSSAEGITASRGEVIGKGQFGTVYRALNMETGESIALKKVNVQWQSKKTQEQVLAIQNEVAIVKRIADHRNVISYFGTARHGSDLYIMMEYAAGGSMASQIKSHGPIKEKLARKWTQEIQHALQHIHEQGVIHRDIKGDNVLIASDGTVKLADFGCCKQLLESSDGVMSLRGTPYWMAPEVIRGEPYGTAADIWSLGATVMEMLHGKPPWIELGQIGALNAVSDKTPVPPLKEHISSQAKDYIMACMNYDLSKRAKLTHLHSHAWILVGPINLMDSPPETPASMESEVSDKEKERKSSKGAYTDTGAEFSSNNTLNNCFLNAFTGELGPLKIMQDGNTMPLLNSSTDEDQILSPPMGYASQTSTPILSPSLLPASMCNPDSLINLQAALQRNKSRQDEVIANHSANSEDSALREDSKGLTKARSHRFTVKRAINKGS